LKKSALLAILLLMALSCREEVIEPQNFVGNINEPVQINGHNSYTFLLNAKNFSMNLSTSAFSGSTRTRFNFSLFDYESGYIFIKVKDFNSTERFSYFVNSDVAYHSELLDGYIPSTINISTDNFTGKIKIEFRKTL
jgi:hypothetical protein